MNTAYDILVIDDDPTILDVLVEALTDEGYTVRTGRNGHEALAAMSEKRPALMCLDMQMPDMNGADVIHAIQGTPLADIPIAIITAQPEKAQPFLRLNNVQYIPKPFDISILLAVIAMYVSVQESTPHALERGALPTHDPVSADGILVVDNDPDVLQLLVTPVLRS